MLLHRSSLEIWHWQAESKWFPWYSIIQNQIPTKEKESKKNPINFIPPIADRNHHFHLRYFVVKVK